MGKSQPLSDSVPGLSPQTEASKLLEQALMQMDGIISGRCPFIGCLLRKLS